MHPSALLFCALWYVFSGLTLYLNKYIVALDMMNEPVLACAQMWACLGLGYLHINFDIGPFKVSI